MRVLITGANGFTGRYLCDLLARSGCTVFGVGLGRAEGVGLAQCLEADLQDTTALTNWLKHSQPSHVIHLAALSHTVGEPLPYYSVNVIGTESLLQAIESSGIPIPRVLIASSASVYGNPGRISTSEDHPLRPLSHYGVSKAAMEMLASKWCTRLPILFVRPFNYTGAGQSERFVYAKIVGSHRRKERHIRLGNLDIARDLSDIEFVGNAYFGLLMSDVHSRAVNICSGRAISLRSVFDMMAEIAGYEIEIEVDSDLVRSDDIEYLCGDANLLNQYVPGLKPVSAPTILQRMYLAEC
jgi:GDP-6-deoxy-D-talose 4-dehydrogenase